MQKPSALTSAEGTRWGLGFDVSEHRDATFVGHGGGDRGIDNYFAWYPQQRLAIAVLCNTDNIGTRQLTERIADLYLPAPPTPQKTASTTPVSRAVTLSSAQLEGKAGLYREVGGNTFVRTFVRDGELRFALGTGTFESLRLVPVSETRFTIGDSTFALEFTPPARAEVMRAFAGETATGTFERVEPFSPSPAQLRAYTGFYASDELNAEWSIAEHGSALIIRRLGNADTVVEPLATDMFTTIGDFMKFSRDARGTIIGFTLTSTGARSLRFERVNR